jgi:hypothetical protein
MNGAEDSTCGMNKGSANWKGATGYIPREWEKKTVAGREEEGKREREPGGAWRLGLS